MLPFPSFVKLPHWRDQILSSWSGLVYDGSTKRTGGALKPLGQQPTQLYTL